MLLLNADAWLVGDALRRLCRRSRTRARPRRSSAPRLSNPDGTLQRSVRGFPRSGGSRPSISSCASSRPASRRPERVLRGRFRPRRGARSRVRDGRVHARPTRRARPSSASPTRASSSSARRPTGTSVPGRRAGTSSSSPDAECVHVRGASHAGRLYRENLRGHLRFFAKHRGPRAGGARAPTAPRRALRLRGAIFRGERGRGVSRLRRRGSPPGDVAELLELTNIELYLRLLFATALVLAPGWALARALGVSQRRRPPSPGR